jgi:hypothetical protein
MHNVGKSKQAPKEDDPTRIFIMTGEFGDRYSCPRDFL